MTAPNAITDFQDAYVKKTDRHAERLAERALDRLRRSSDRLNLVELTT